MRKVFSMEYHAVHFLLVYLLVSVLISLTFGSFESCEYEDANLIWRNIPEYSLRDVKAMAWYKGKNCLIATWLEGKEFMQYPPYIGRLIQIGETGIKIKTANRSDSGIYWLSLTLASVDHKLEAETYLEVKVAPSKLCKPRITQEGSFIKADLPHEGCGIPHLRTKWKHSNMNISQENSTSFLDMRTIHEPGEYMACAEGESATCYKGDISDLCSTHTNIRTIHEPGEYMACAEIESATCYKGDIIYLCSTHSISTSDHESTPVVFSFVIVLTAIVVVLVLCRHKIRCQKPSWGFEERVSETDNIAGEEQKKSKDCEMSTIADPSDEILKAEQPKTKRRTKLYDIEKYLKEHYEGLVTVPLSPSGKGDDNVKISDVYVNIKFRKVTITDLNHEESISLSGTQLEEEPLINKDQVPKNKNKCVCPILIFGDCGSGKSAWCKHLIQCWLQGVNIKHDNIGLNLPDLRKIKILLYLPLQFSDRGISFQDLLKKHLFKDTQSYQTFVMNYVKTNAQEVLLVMDGLDIIKENIKPILDIYNDAHISLSTVIITSRPASLKLLQDRCCAKIEHMMLFRICKLSLEDFKSYASNVLSHINQLHGKNFKVVNFWRFTEQLHVHDLLSVPYICLVLLHVWMKSENCFIEISDVIFDIIHYYLHSAISDQQRKEFIEDTSDTRSTNVLNDLTKFNKWKVQKEHIYILHVLSRIAAQIFFSEIEGEPMKLNVTKMFPITDEDDIDLQRICETGLLTEPLSLSDTKKVSNMSFPNRIICEFFVSVFIVLQEGNDCDFILPCLNASVQTSMIIQILYQLSDTLTKDIIRKAIKLFGKKNTRGDKRCNYLNDKIGFSLTSSDASAVKWLQWHINNDTLNTHKLLLMSTALHCIDTITSLELKIDDNNENLGLHLPCLPVLECLTLDINKCTLILCKEWDNHVPCKLKHVVIGSVTISKGILSLLIGFLASCESLETLKLFPSIMWTDDAISLQKKPDLDNYSWTKLSKHIENNKKLKILELKNLVLPGLVDTLLSQLNRYQNLEMLTLTNVSTIMQERPPLSHSADTDNCDDVKPHMKVSLTQLSLGRLKLTESPIDFLFNSSTKDKPNENRINLLSISALEMPEKSWETLGRQISNLRLTEFHLSSVNPGDSLQIILDGIGEIKTLNSLSLCKIVTGERIPSFSFLPKMNELSQLKLRDMKLDGSSSSSLFKHICGCKALQKLALCNIDFEEIPNTLSSVQELTKLSVLNVDRVNIKRGSQSLNDLLKAFSKCKNLRTTQVKVGP